MKTHKQTVTIALRVPRALAMAIRQQATLDDRTVSSYLRRLIEVCLPKGRLPTLDTGEPLAAYGRLPYRDLVIEQINKKRRRRT